MCGRFTQMIEWAELVRLYRLADKWYGRNTPARYNVAPTQTVPFVHQGRDGEQELSEGRWWLVPFWAKEMPKHPTFNARSEEADVKSSFKDSFKAKRCLIPADGFYEWTKGEDGGKDPWFIHLPDRKPFSGCLAMSSFTEALPYLFPGFSGVVLVSRSLLFYWRNGWDFSVDFGPPLAWGDEFQASGNEMRPREKVFWGYPITLLTCAYIFGAAVYFFWGH
ncbi:SOS response-associated peptidase [Sinorhizobium fredii]|uniref:SOS response-associated peptidase n=1 Tax=Rhizobium fredii TaxID=380 RepID=UPI003CE5BC8F